MNNLLTTKYVLMSDDHTAFAYLDMGDVKYDQRTPRRSGMADTLDKALRIKDNMEYAANDKRIEWYEEKIANLHSHPSPFGQQIHDMIEDYEDLINELKNNPETFSIVKMTLEPVDLNDQTV